MKIDQKIIYYIFLPLFMLNHAEELSHNLQTLSEWCMFPHAVTHQQFILTLTTYIALQQKAIEDTLWFGEKIEPYDPTFNTLQSPSAIKPYVLKLKLADVAHIFCWGDLHGDIYTLILSLYKLYQDRIISNDLKICSPHTYFLFLGDLVDRGAWGPEVMTLIFTIALKNPGQVIIVRGNHEDLHQNCNMTGQNFLKDLLRISQLPYPSTEFNELLNAINQLYNLLPVACYIGTNDYYLQCCHGGLECRYNPHDLLNTAPPKICQSIGALKVPETLHVRSPYFWHDLYIDISCAPIFQNIPANAIKTYDLGFLWNDFNAWQDNFKAQFSELQQNNRISVGRALVQETLKFYNSGKAQVKGFLRAHQHNDSMPGLLNPLNNGIYTLWNNQVITTIATNMFGTPNCFLKIQLHNRFDRWILNSYSYNYKDGTWLLKSAKFKYWQNAA